MSEPEPQYLDDDHAAIVGFAETFLDEDEREAFVDSLMERRGYQRVSSWAPPEDQGGGQGGGQGGKQPLLRQRGGGPRQQGGQGGQRRAPYFKR